MRVRASSKNKGERDGRELESGEWCKNGWSGKGVPERIWGGGA